MSHVESHTAPATAEVQQGQAVPHAGPGDVQLQHLLLGLGQAGRLLLRLAVAGVAPGSRHRL